MTYRLTGYHTFQPYLSVITIDVLRHWTKKKKKKKRPVSKTSSG